jgi:alpha-tubulin suppressor-like RCC1 family protein
VERPKAPEGFITEPPHYKNYPQTMLPPLQYNKRCIETRADVVWSWGLGHSGRLALGERANVVHTPRRTMDLLADAGGRSGKFDNPNRAIPNHGPIASLALGHRHTLVLTERGGVLACGHGVDGQLGVASGDLPRPEQQTPIPVRFPKPLAHIVFVAAGGRTSYAISRRGQVFAWGCGKYGQLGLGDEYLKGSSRQPKRCHRPTLIPELSSVQATGVVHIAAGANHAHAMTASGALYSWGHNKAGQLGLGDTSTRSKPVLVREFRFRDCTVLGVSTSSKFSMAIVEGPIAMPAHTPSPEEEEETYDHRHPNSDSGDKDHLHGAASALVSAVDVDRQKGGQANGLAHLLITGRQVGRGLRGSTAPSGDMLWRRGGIGLYDSAPSVADYMNPKNWSKTLVRAADGTKLPAVTHISFRPRTREAAFLGYEPEILSRPSTRGSSGTAGTGSRPPSRASTPAHIRKLRRKRRRLAVEHNVEQVKAKAARSAWMEKVGFDKTKSIFSGLRPKGDSEQAAKKVLGTFFEKKLDIEDALDILSTLQENFDDEFVQRVAFEAWLREGDLVAAEVAVAAAATGQPSEASRNSRPQEGNGEEVVPLKKRAMTAPLSGEDPFADSSVLSGMPFAGSEALLQRLGGGDIQQGNVVLERTELERAETEVQVVELFFSRIDSTSEGPHVLPNQSVFEQGREKKKKQWLHCIAAEKEAILEAAEDRTHGLMGTDLIDRIESDPALYRLRLLLVPNLIAGPLRALSTELPNRVKAEELIELFLKPQMHRLRMVLLRVFDLTMTSDEFQTRAHAGTVQRSAVRRAMTSGWDAKHVIGDEPSLVSIFRQESYAHQARNPLSAWRDGEPAAGGGSGSTTREQQRRREGGGGEHAALGENTKPPPFIPPILYVKPRKKKKIKVKSKKARAKMLKKDLDILDEKVAAAKDKERKSIGHRAFETCQRRDYEHATMAAEDHRSITIHEFVDFVLVTAGRSPEGRSYDGFGCGTPPRRQAVFVWGFGDQRLGLGREAAEWFELPGRDPNLRHQTLPRLCRPLTDDVDSPVEAIALGEEHGMVLTRDRRVYTWGSNAFCQLGLRDNRDRPDPEELVFLEGCVDIDASRYWSMALRHTGELYSWGQGRDGVLGHGETISRCAPHLMLSFSGRRVQHIAAGPSHAMAITGRAPTFMTARPEKRIRWHRRTRGVERWRLTTNRAARLRNGRDALHEGARLRPPSFHFGFVPGERKRLDAADVADQRARHFRPKEIQFGDVPVLPPPKREKERQNEEAARTFAEAFPRPPWLPVLPEKEEVDQKEEELSTSDLDTASLASAKLTLHGQLLPASARRDTTLPLHVKLLPASRRPSHSQSSDQEPLSTPLSSSSLSSPRRGLLPPLPLDIAVFGDGKSRFVFPVTQDHAASMPRDPLFDQRTISHLVEGLDSTSKAYVPDQLRPIREQLWREHRDRAFIERRKRRTATIRIQAVSRRFSVRNWIYFVWRKKAAATLLQRRQRGIRGRKKAQRRREELAVIKLQQRIRGRIVFRKNQPRMAKAMAAGRQKMLEKNSAIAVQKRVRGIIGRKRSQKLLKKKRKADRKAEKARKKAEAARLKAEAAAALRAETLKKARGMYDPTGEMEDEEVIEIAKAMGGDWSGFGDDK